MAKTQERIVIRRKKSHNHGHHGGSWKIAYADFVTAMMAFFLVMWLLSLVPGKDLRVIAEYFRMPLLTAVMGGPQIDNSASPIPGGSPSIVPNPFSLRPMDEDALEDQRDLQRLEDLKAELEALIEADPTLREFRPQMLLDMTPDGLRIQIIDRQHRPMFDIGSARVQPYMRTILRALGPMLNKVHNPLNISGHTDARQYATGERLYSNWELSADRANAARQELVAGGMSEARVRQVMGLASTLNLIQDDPYAAVNRRISVVVLNRATQRRLDAENAVRGPIGSLEQLSAIAAAQAEGEGEVLFALDAVTPQAAQTASQAAQAASAAAVPAATP